METRDTQRAAGAPPVVTVGEARSTRAPTWLVVLTAVLGVVAVGLGAWLIVDRLSQPEEVTAAEAAQRVDASERAMNAGDWLTFGGMFAEDAVFEDEILTEDRIGRTTIVNYQKLLYDDVGFVSHRTTDVQMVGDDTAVYATAYGPADDPEAAVAIMIVTWDDGQIVRQVAFEP